MGKMTPSQAKNAIRRALSGVVDQHPSATQIHSIWQHFADACAYCGNQLIRGRRDGHIDHLIPTGSGGSNALGNRVLACGVCNGDEKRDEHWEGFLRRKATDPAVFAARKRRIEDWIATHGAIAVDSALAAVVSEEIAKVWAAFDVALQRIRRLKHGA